MQFFSPIRLFIKWIEYEIELHELNIYEVLLKMLYDEQLGLS